MMKQHFNFPKMDFEREIAGLGKQIETSKQALEGLKIEDASAANARIEKQIDRLYAAMETEYQARGPVEENLDVLSRFIAHAQNQNRVLLRELERSIKTIR